MKLIEKIILANIAIFFITIAAPDFVFDLMALQPSTVLHKPWTLITNMFVHAGLDHIFFNMIALFFFGVYLEGLVGEKIFGRIYFAGGLFASIAYVFTSLVFNIPPPDIPAVGASGAVFAVMGALVVLQPNLTIFVSFFFPMPLYIWAALYTMYAASLMFFTMGNVAHNAHLGGLVAGLVFGYYLKKKITQQAYARQYGYRFY